jgi:subfamily B ATP-binding cassette protein MsbA
MKLYFRLLAFCRPIGKYVVPYVLFTVLHIIFSIINFTLVIPLLKVLFELVPKEELEQMLVKPIFDFSTGYVIKLFNYHFATYITQYGKFAALEFVCVIIILSFLVSNIFRYLAARMIERLKMQTIRNMRNAMFDKIISLHIGHFSKNRKGDIMGRIIADVSEVEASITSTLAVIFKEPVTLIFYFATLLLISPKLTLFTIVIIPISATIISLIVKKLKKDARSASESFGRLISIIDEAITGIKVIKAFTAEKITQLKFKNENNNYTHLNRKMAMRRELASPFSEFSGVLVVSFILLYGGAMVLAPQPEMNAEVFIMYLIIYSQVTRPAKALSNSLTGLNRGLAAGERLLELLDTKVDVVENPEGVKIKSFNKNIEFRNVSFSYSKKPILKNLNFSIEAGKIIALVGPSGGGKSTIADLIPRFYDPNEGQILIDGIDLRDCDIQSLRSLMGNVTQESILFNDTIFNNIAFGKPNASEEDVIRAAKIANAHDFIMATENGYKTIIGDRGVRLSGGQKQRLSIARAVLKNPPILILDEATSALDTESEKLVQDALNSLIKNRTTLVIAHRLSTIQSADEILVIQDGEIIERGSHEELLRINKGVYQKLSMMQSA